MAVPAACICRVRNPVLDHDPTGETGWLVFSNDLNSRRLLLVKKCHGIEDGKLTISDTKYSACTVSSRSKHLHLWHEMPCFTHLPPVPAHSDTHHMKQNCPSDEV